MDRKLPVIATATHERKTRGMYVHMYIIRLGNGHRVARHIILLHVSVQSVERRQTFLGDCTIRVESLVAFVAEKCVLEGLQSAILQY